HPVCHTRSSIVCFALCSSVSSLTPPPPPLSPLLPYTTLFRSPDPHLRRQAVRPARQPAADVHAPVRARTGVVEHRRRARHARPRSEEHTSELQSRENLVCRLLLEKKKKNITKITMRPIQMMHT